MELVDASKDGQEAVVIKVQFINNWEFNIVEIQSLAALN